MTAASEVSKRYAKALFEACESAVTREKVQAQLRGLVEGLDAAPEAQEFLLRSSVPSSEKVKVIQAALNSQIAEPVLSSFLGVLGQRGRLEILSEVLSAFIQLNDSANGVVRGLVRSAEELGPEDRRNLEEKVSRATGKKVILDYRVDRALIGGLTAQVGAMTFSDSIDMHLGKLGEELKKRGH